MFDLYDQFELVEKQTIAGVEHPKFNFVSDGWAASIKLADKWELEGDDALLQDVIFQKTIQSPNFVSRLLASARLDS